MTTWKRMTQMTMTNQPWLCNCNSVASSCQHFRVVCATVRHMLCSKSRAVHHPGVLDVLQRCAGALWKELRCCVGPLRLHKSLWTSCCLLAESGVVG
jgi:hypothetical protein